MFELTAEAILLLLRLALVALLYLFLGSVVLAAGRELRRLTRQPTLPPPAGVSARLVVVDPGATNLVLGETLPLRPLTRLGRSNENTIVLDDTFISAEHAVIFQRDGGWWVSDRGSTNGTSLNDRLVVGEVAVAPGDIVGIGDVRLKVTR